MGAVKIATCCYCGTKAALVLRGKSRHELSCGQCGAPLRALKMLKVEPGYATAPVATPARPDHRPVPKKGRYADDYRKKKRSKRSRFFKNVISEIWDEIEDIFD